MAASHFYTGQLLLALPAIGDPRFDHAVIALASHDAGGAMGVAINLAADLSVADLLDRAGVAAQIDVPGRVLVGGPVEPQRGFVVHSRDWGGEGTIDVAGLFALSGALDVLKAIAAGRGPSRWQIALGYAGWGPGQLESEIACDAWHVTPSDPASLFDIAPDARWRAIMARDGIDPARIVMRGGQA